MRLLERHSDGELSLTKDLINNIPAYAILSHTWGDDDQEVTLKDLTERSGKSKAGYKKLRFCGEQAALDGLRYFWVDTCCIDKSNNTELSEALNSMYRWYRNAAKCYVYLADVSHHSAQLEDTFRDSRWFTRGWTLQELIAPQTVQFFSLEGELIGDRKSLERQIYEITQIPILALQGKTPSEFSVTERFSWAAKRETKKEEDNAYSLLGIFGIFLPLIYGEGRENAFRRLREEISKCPNGSQPSDTSVGLTFTIPFRRDPDFVDRSNLLDQIRQKCAVPGSWTALVGLGGVGKSQLAIEYTYHISEQSQKTWVFWVHASNIARFEQGYRDIADRLKISGRENPKTNIFKLVHSYLCDRSIGQWLIILDNADDTSFLLEAQNRERAPHSNGLNNINSQPLVSFIPQYQNGSVLITTRSRNAALKLVEESDIIKIDPMEEKLALTLLEKKLGVQSESDNLTELVAVLDFMPLAIVQAAAYISQRAPRCSVQQYLEQFQKNDRKRISLLENEAGHLRRDREANNSILITWQISFDYLRQNRPSAADLLSLMSFFDRQGIPETLLRIQPEWGSSDRHLEADNNEDTLSDADSNTDTISEASQDGRFEADITTLREFSFISVSVNRTMFEMHRLVQLATRNWLQASGQLEKWKQQYIKNLYSEFPIGDHEHWEKCQLLFPHVKLVVTQKPEGEGLLAEWAALLYNAACYAWKKGNIIDAEIMAIRAMKMRKKLYSQEHKETLCSIEMVGLVYNLGGRWREAEDLFVQVVETRKRVLGQEHPDTLTSIANLALIYRNQGRWKEAEDLGVQVIETSSRVLGQEHLDTLTSMANLASTYWDQGRWKEAEDIDIQVVETSSRVLGQEHPRTLHSIANLASTYRDQGRWKEAEDLDVQMTETRKRVLGQEHPDTLTSIANLALTYGNQGRWKEAEDLFVQVVETRNRVLGQEHPDTLTSMANLASIYWDQGRWKESEDLDIQVVETSSRVLGQEHPRTLHSIANLASTYRNQGRWKEAEDLFIQVIETRKRVLGQEHPDTLTSMNNLAFIWKAQGRDSEALDLIGRCVLLQTRILGVDHPHTSSSSATLIRWREEEQERSV